MQYLQPERFSSKWEHYRIRTQTWKLVPQGPSVATLLVNFLFFFYCWFNGAGFVSVPQINAAYSESYLSSHPPSEHKDFIGQDMLDLHGDSGGDTGKHTQHIHILLCIDHEIIKFGSIWIHHFNDHYWQSQPLCCISRTATGLQNRISSMQPLSSFFPTPRRFWPTEHCWFGSWQQPMAPIHWGGWLPLCRNHAASWAQCFTSKWPAWPRGMCLAGKGQGHIAQWDRPLPCMGSGGQVTPVSCVSRFSFTL